MSAWEESSDILGSHSRNESETRKRELGEDWTELDAPKEGELKEGEETKKQKKKRNIYSEQHLLGSKGLPFIYSTFSTLFGRQVANGYEGEALRDLITGYKEWAYELFPNLNFEDFIERTEVVAKKSAVSSLITEMRQKERKRGEPEEEIIEPTASEQWDEMMGAESKDKKSHNNHANYAAHESDEEIEFNLPVEKRSSPREAIKNDESDGEAEFDFAQSAQPVQRITESDGEAEIEFDSSANQPSVSAGVHQDPPDQELNTEQQETELISSRTSQDEASTTIASEGNAKGGELVGAEDDSSEEVRKGEVNNVEAIGNGEAQVNDEGAT